jgi:hypothetical protein
MISDLAYYAFSGLRERAHIVIQLEPSEPKRPVGMAAHGRLTDLYRHAPGGGIFDFHQQAVETACARSFRG